MEAAFFETLMATVRAWLDSFIGSTAKELAANVADGLVSAEALLPVAVPEALIGVVAIIGLIVALKFAKKLLSIICGIFVVLVAIAMYEQGLFDMDVIRQFFTGVISLVA